MAKDTKTAKKHDLDLFRSEFFYTHHSGGGLAPGRRKFTARKHVTRDIRPCANGCLASESRFPFVGQEFARYA